MGPESRSSVPPVNRSWAPEARETSSRRAQTARVVRSGLLGTSSSLGEERGFIDDDYWRDDAPWGANALPGSRYPAIEFDGSMEYREQLPSYEDLANENQRLRAELAEVSSE